MSVKTLYIGIIDGLHAWEVRDADGTVIGMNQSAEPPVGWTLDEATGDWLEPA